MIYTHSTESGNDAYLQGADVKQVVAALDAGLAVSPPHVLLVVVLVVEQRVELSFPVLQSSAIGKMEVRDSRNSSALTIF